MPGCANTTTNTLWLFTKTGLKATIEKAFETYGGEIEASGE